MQLARSQHVRIKAKQIFYEAAAAKLKECLDPDFQAQLKMAILVEVTTKRFEYTFEALWKCLKEILTEEGMQTVSPLNCFQEAFRLGLIPKMYEEVFPVMVKKRNEIVHIYSEENAEAVYVLIKNTFAQAIFAVLETIRTKVAAPFSLE